MNDQLLSSKMVVQEESSGVRGIAGASTTVCGAVGVAERGPIGKPTLCSGLPDYQNRFGRILPGSDLSQGVMGFFLNASGNGTMWVVRTVHYTDVSDPKTATAKRASGFLAAVQPVPATVVAANAAPYVVNDGDELAVSVGGGPDQIITFHGTSAWVAAGSAGPYALADGQTLDVRVDGGQVEVTFSAKAFANVGAATPQEVIAVLGPALHGATCDLLNGAPRITSPTRGNSIIIEITFSCHTIICNSSSS